MSVADYRFSSQPRTIENRDKYRSPEDYLPSNLMFDRRIVRGNTYAAMIVPDASRQDLERRERLEKSYRARQQERLREKETEEQLKAYHGEEFSKIEVPILEDKAFIEYEELALNGQNATATQFEFYIDRPPSPELKKLPAGIHKACQVEFDEIFDFDIEVIPILEVIIGKSLEQARVEVLEEDEISTSRRNRARFLQERNAELIEIQRIESEHKRYEEEYDRRKLQSATIREQMQMAHQKYVSRIFTKRFLQPLLRTTCKELEDIGTFKDPEIVSMHDQMLPWMLQQTYTSVKDTLSFELFLENIRKHSIEDIVKKHREAKKMHLKNLENQKETALNKIKDDEKRRADRVLLRVEREERRKRNAAMDLVYSEIIEKGNKVRKSTGQHIADIDDLSTQNILAVPGGLIGELVNMFVCLETVLEQGLTQAQMNDVMENYVMSKSEELTLNVIEDNYKTLCEELEIEDFYNVPEEKQNRILEFLKDPMNSDINNTLADMRKNPEFYKFRPELIDMFYNSLYSILTAPNIEDEENPLKRKITLHKIKGNELVETRFAVVKIVKNAEDDQESSGNSSSKTYTGEDKTIILPQVSNDLSVFLVHQSSYHFIRKELANWVCSLNSFLSVESGTLYTKMMENAEDYLNRRLDLLASSLYCFEFQAY